MKLFPDKAVPEIVEGLEAAKRLLDAGANPFYSFRPADGLQEYVESELALIHKATLAIEALRRGRYLAPALNPPTAPTPKE